MRSPGTWREEDARSTSRLCGGSWVGLLLAACLAFSVGLIASSAAGTNSATFRLAVASQAGSSTESIYAVAAVAPDALALTATARRNADPWYGAPAGGPNGRCFVLIDRHNHKTGGTTMRDIMLQNARYGDCHYWGYGQDEPHWSAWLAEANKLLPTAGRAPGGQPIRLCLEAHFPVFDFMTLRVPAIAALRDAARAPAASAARGCSVVLTTRVREPVSFYLSFYKWDIAGRVESGRDGGAERFGKSFLEWRPLNLQSNALLNAMTTEWASNWYSNQQLQRVAKALHIKNASFALLLRALDRFDLVGTVEQFDEALLLTNDMLGGGEGQPGGGLPRLQYRRTRPVHRHRAASKPPYTSADICPDMDACRRHVRAIAPLDFVLYERYADAFRRRLAALGEPFAARVRAFKAAGRAPWVGGVDPELATPSPCSWQADANGAQETYNVTDNPCVPAPAQLGVFADRCMGLTKLNARACCVRFQPNDALRATLSAARIGAAAAERKLRNEFATVWASRVCRNCDGECRATSSARAAGAPVLARPVDACSLPPLPRAAAPAAGDAAPRGGGGGPLPRATRSAARRRIGARGPRADGLAAAADSERTEVPSSGPRRAAADAE